MEIAPYLKLMVDKNASDIYFSAGAPVHIKVEGKMLTVGETPLPPATVKAICYSLFSEKQLKEFEDTMEMNLALALKDVGRFRVNVFRQRGEAAMVIRYIKSEIPSLNQLNLPPVLGGVIMEPRGLVLVVGATGSGKSTTLASMIDLRNRSQTGHILTIEDPVEFLHSHKKSVVNQREVGLDTLSYEAALKNALREAPDVILIGEIRDRQTMQHALAYAETGHLCLSTLHANNANQALERIVNFFPESAREQLLLDLALNLKAVISQRLLQGMGGKRVPAVEVLVPSPHIRDLIIKGEIASVKEAMEQSAEPGMQTFDQALYKLYKDGKVTADEAIAHADSRNNLSLRIRLDEGGGNSETFLDVDGEDFDH